MKVLSCHFRCVMSSRRKCYRPTHEGGCEWGWDPQCVGRDVQQDQSGHVN